MSKNEHRSTARVLLILLELSRADNGLTLAELSTKLDAPKSSLFSIVHTMANMKFIDYNSSSQKYSIGLNCFLTGSSYLQAHSALDYIRNEMKVIVNKCSEICQFGIFEEGDVLYLLKVDSPEPVRLYSDIGKRLPAYCTSLGKALLSNSSKENLKLLYPEPFTSFTPNTVKDIDSLYLQLQKVKSSSIAIEKGEIHPDISCLATPIIKDNKIIAAISVSIPSFRFSDKKQNEISHILLESKYKLEKILAHTDFISGF